MSRLQAVPIIFGVALALLVLFFFFSGRGAPPEPLPPTPAVQAEEPPPVQGSEPPPAPQAIVPPPLQYRANTILPVPDPALTYTSMSIDIDGGDPVAALSSIMDAANVSIQPPRNRRPQNANPMELNIHLRNQPFMEALLELEAQSSLCVSNSANGLMAQYSGPGLPGIWSVTGPFAFVLLHMQHDISLNADGTAQNAGRSGVNMQFNLVVEPHTHVLRYPMELKVIEAQDENGNSLVSDETRAGAMSSSTVNFPERAWLRYPADNAGKRIKHFRATAACLLQLKSEELTIADPAHGALEKDLGNGIHAQFAQAVWEKNSHDFIFKATYRKAAYKGDWATFANGLISATLHPGIAGFENAHVNVNGSVSGDVATVTYLVIIPGSFKGSPAVVVQVNEAPPFDSLTLELPVELTQMDIPVEFNDIPLP